VFFPGESGFQGKNCQKQAGTAFSVIFGIPKPALSLQGTLKTFDDRGDSGNPVYRRFCPECGSPILSETVTAAASNLAIIKAGTLDDASWLKPTLEIYCDSAQPWVELGGERQRFPKMPPPR